MQFKDIQYYEEKSTIAAKRFLNRYTSTGLTPGGRMTPVAYLNYCLPELTELFGEDLRIRIYVSWNKDRAGGSNIDGSYIVANIYLYDNNISPDLYKIFYQFMVDSGLNPKNSLVCITA